MAAVIKIEITTAGGLDQVKSEVAAIGAAAEKSGGGFSALQEIATGALRRIGEAAINLAGAAFAKLGDVIGDSIGAARESNVVAAQTAAVIKSTGGAAGVTAQQVLDYASSLSAASGQSLFGDEQIAQSSNMLLTFTNIKGAALNAATAISVDMAQAFGGAPKDAAIQLGKALNDPIKGITALTRVGVTFTDEQKAMIQAMQEAGDMAGAQQVILDELNREFGGSAAAAAAADGGVAQFHDRLGEMEETIGKAILPILGQLMGVLNTTLLPALESAAASFATFVSGIMSADDPLLALVDALIPISPELAGIVAAIFDLITTGGDLTVAISDLSEGFGIDLSGALNVASAVFSTVTSVVLPAALGIFAALQATVQQVFGVIAQYIPAVMYTIQAVIGAVLAQVQAFWQAHGAQVMAFIQQTWATISTIITTALQLILSIVVGVLASVASFISAHGAAIQTILSGAWQAISGVITAALAVIQGVLQAGLAVMRGDWQGAWAAIQSMSASFVSAIGSAIVGFLDMIAGFFGSSLSQIAATWSGAFEGMLSAAMAFAGQAVSIGAAIIDGIVSGIVGAAGRLAQAAADAASAALAAAKSAIGMESPAKAFMPVGASMVEGMAVGIADSKQTLFDAMKDITDRAGAFLGFGGSVARGMQESIRARDQQLRGIVGAMDDIRKAAKDGPLDVQQQTELLHLEQQRREIAAGLVADQRTVSALEQQQDKLGFLQEQIKLLSFIKEHNLNPSDILGGLTLGANADPKKLVDAMTAASTALVTQLQQQLGLAVTGGSGAIVVPLGGSGANTAPQATSNSRSFTYAPTIRSGSSGGAVDLMTAKALAGM